MLRQSKGFARRAMSVIRQSKGFTQRAMSVIRQSKGFTGRAMSVIRQSKGFAQRAMSVIRQSKGFTQRAMSVIRQSKGFTRRAMSYITLHPGLRTVQSEFENAFEERVTLEGATPRIGAVRNPQGLETLVNKLNEQIRGIMANVRARTTRSKNKGTPPVPEKELPVKTT
jgi:ribosomal protein L20